MARNHAQLGPYSRRLARGSLDDLYDDGRSAGGRYVRALEAELVAHCGGSPTATQRHLIKDAILLRLQIDGLAEKQRTGPWTSHDTVTFSGALRNHRSVLRDLGLSPAAARAPTLAEAMAESRAARERGEAA
jgi:hypothetical protein